MWAMVLYMTVVHLHCSLIIIIIFQNVFHKTILLQGAPWKSCPGQLSLRSNKSYISLIESQSFLAF